MKVTRGFAAGLVTTLLLLSAGGMLTLALVRLAVEEKNTASMGAPS
jgi:hypothetical protein